MARAVLLGFIEQEVEEGTVVLKGELRDGRLLPERTECACLVEILEAQDQRYQQARAQHPVQYRRRSVVLHKNGRNFTGIRRRCPCDFLGQNGLAFGWPNLLSLRGQSLAENPEKRRFRPDRQT